MEDAVARVFTQSGLLMIGKSGPQASTVDRLDFRRKSWWGLRPYPSSEGRPTR